VAQEFQGADDGLLNGQLRLPAERPYACAIQEDERAVSHPSAFAACVLQLGRQTQMRAELGAIRDLPGISPNLFEVAGKMMN